MSQGGPCSTHGASPRASLHVEPEVHAVAVPDDVLLALDAQQTLLPDRGLASEPDQVLPVEDLGLDEAALEVRVDDARSLGGLRALVEGPGATFLLAHREERLQTQHPVAGSHNLVQ